GSDQLSVCRSSVPRKLPEQVFPDAAPRPAHKAVIDRGRRTILRRAIAPATAALQYMHNAADDPTIVRPLDAPNIRRQARFDPVDIRWPAGDADRYRSYAADLVGLAPDVILASASASVAALQQASRSAPIVFANVIDPVGAGFVTSLAQPGGNATGFTAFEYGISG